MQSIVDESGALDEQPGFPIKTARSESESKEKWSCFVFLGFSVWFGKSV